MKITFLSCFIIFSLFASAQPYDADKVNKNALSFYNKAMELLQDEKLKEAIPLLNSAIATDNRYVEAYLSLAGVYGQLKDYQQSINFYEKSRDIDTNYFRFFYQSYAINLAGLGRFSDALQAVNRFLAVTDLSEKSRKSGEYRKAYLRIRLAICKQAPRWQLCFCSAKYGRQCELSYK